MTSHREDVRLDVVERAAFGRGPDGGVGAAVLAAVGRADGRDPTALPPLYDRFDPDALEALVASASDSAADLCVEFASAGFVVSVRGHGEIVVYETGE
ncbi:MAG: HalOD1 output domain-containing protein [Haloferacaceae archaeon]